MFKCTKCNKVNTGESEVKIPSVVRKVVYLLQVKPEFKRYEQEGAESEPELKTIGQKEGFEIVEEIVYCSKCVPKDFKPKVLEEEVSRKRKTC